MSDAITTQVASSGMKESDLSKSNLDNESDKGSDKDMKSDKAKTVIDENGLNNVIESEKLNNGAENQASEKEPNDSTKENVSKDTSKYSNVEFYFYLSFFWLIVVKKF